MGKRAVDLDAAQVRAEQDYEFERREYALKLIADEQRSIAAVKAMIEEEEVDLDYVARVIVRAAAAGYKEAADMVFRAGLAWSDAAHDGPRLRSAEQQVELEADSEAERLWEMANDK